MLKDKTPNYYRGIREDIVELVDTGVSSVLDIGCAAGRTGEKLKQGGVKEIIGVELDPEAHKEAGNRLDKVFLGDIEKMELPFKDGYFDCIIYADILEHLINPWSVLRKHRRLLKEGGTLIASIPNVRHYRVIKKLLRGKWDYEERGVLDSAHLRFFTLKTVKKMFSDSGYRIDNLIYKISASKSKKLINKILRGALNEILAEQFLIKARKV